MKTYVEQLDKLFALPQNKHRLNAKFLVKEAKEAYILKTGSLKAGRRLKKINAYQKLMLNTLIEHQVGKYKDYTEAEMALLWEKYYGLNWFELDKKYRDGSFMFNVSIYDLKSIINDYYENLCLQFQNLPQCSPDVQETIKNLLRWATEEVNETGTERFKNPTFEMFLFQVNDVFDFNDIKKYKNHHDRAVLLKLYMLYKIGSGIIVRG